MKNYFEFSSFRVLATCFHHVFISFRSFRVGSVDIQDGPIRYFAVTSGSRSEAPRSEAQEKIRCSPTAHPC